MSKIKTHFVYVLWLMLVSHSFLFAQENPEDIALAEDKIENDFYESLKQRAIENYDKAIIAIEKCITTDANNPVFYHELGKNLLDLKQYPQAEKAFQKAIDLNPKERWYWNGLYDVYYQLKEYQKSIPIVQKLIEFDPNMKEDLISLYMYTNQRDKALELLKQMENEMVLSKTMEFYKLKIQESNSFAKPEKNELEKAIKNNPQEEQNYIDLILLYSESNQEEKAFEVAKKLADAIPNSDWAKISLFKFYLVENNGAEASKALLTVLKNDKLDMKIKQRMLNEFLLFVVKTNTYESELMQAVDYVSSDTSINSPLEIGKFYFNKKLYDKAIPYLEKGLKKEVENLNNVILLIKSYDNTQQFEALAKLTEDYIDLFPSQVNLYYYAGYANNKTTNFKKAKSYLETGLEFLVEDAELEYQFYIQLAEVYKNLGDQKKETLYLSKAKEIVKK
ncbi:Cytochrome C biosynthesis protein [Flavobacterium sp. 9AF]|uniref:tetratricopeptide repeat protein n=1 Tax=Flavobacterium sp. 9AF TaxID=2653142 RepID=UPI0012F3B602|nr:tetratricopeptide repeat protein [Flavobacterium sp. 9AF]VXB31694.1 Cytochrome C biosynthesis protein [Flavobacterium sp. 9AF]